VREKENALNERESKTFTNLSITTRIGISLPAYSPEDVDLPIMKPQITVAYLARLAGVRQETVAENVKLLLPLAGRLDDEP